MNNKKLKNQMNVNKEWNKYLIKKGDQAQLEKKSKCKLCNHEVTTEKKPKCKLCNHEVTVERKPKCKLCLNHGVTSFIKNHKNYCPYRNCLCMECYDTKKNRERSAKDIKISRQRQQIIDKENERKEKKINVNELQSPLPLEFNAKYTFIKYHSRMHEKYKFVSSLTETLARIQYHPISWLLIPVVSDLFNTILRYTQSSDEDDIHDVKSYVDQVLQTAQIQYENWACNVRNISYEKSIYHMETIKQNALQLLPINSLTWPSLPWPSLTSVQPSYSENLITLPQSDNASPFENTSISPRLENTSSSPKDTKMCSDNLNTPMYPGPSAAYHW